jgi:hypothetical protein
MNLVHTLTNRRFKLFTQCLGILLQRNIADSWLDAGCSGERDRRSQVQWLSPQLLSLLDYCGTKLRNGLCTTTRLELTRMCVSCFRNTLSPSMKTIASCLQVREALS